MVVWHQTLDYIALGVTTGEITPVLKGEDINTIPVAVVTDSKPVYWQRI